MCPISSYPYRYNCFPALNAIKQNYSAKEVCVFELKMEQIEGDRAGSVVWLDDNGYLYILNKKTNGGFKKYFQCRVYFCPARAKIINNSPPIVTPAHNHEPDELIVEVLRLKAVLRNQSETTNFSMANIFANTIFRYSQEAVAAIGGLEGIRATMYRSRSRGTPQIPANLREYAVALEDDRWRGRYAIELGPGQMAFFRRFVEAGDESTAVIFASPTILNYVNRGMQVALHMDATFKVVPRRGAGSQLFCVHIHYNGAVYPILYILMERKTFAAYLVVLRLLRQLAPQINVRSVMTDYEVALRQAVRATFPGVELLGCWFHFARAVYKRAASMGFARRNVDGETRRIVKMAMALPLLPAHLTAQGIEEIRVAAENRIEFDPFIAYLEAQWLPANISVYRQPHRTNNAVESFHRDLLRLVSREHPNIWVFTEWLQRVEHLKAVDFQRSLNAQRLPRRPRVPYQRLNQKINNAQNILDVNGDVHWFLLRMSHSMNRLVDEFHAGLAHDDAEDNPRLHPQLQNSPQPNIVPQPHIDSQPFIHIQLQPQIDPLHVELQPEIDPLQVQPQPEIPQLHIQQPQMRHPQIQLHISPQHHLLLPQRPPVIHEPRFQPYPVPLDLLPRLPRLLDLLPRPQEPLHANSPPPDLRPQPQQPLRSNSPPPLIYFK